MGVAVLDIVCGQTHMQDVRALWENWLRAHHVFGLLLLLRFFLL